MDTTTIPAPTTVDKLTLGKFTGALGAFQTQAYHDIRACGVDAKVAHKIAADFGSDLGQGMRNNPEIGLAVGKLSKDKERPMRFSGKFAKQLASRSMNMLRLVGLVETMHKEELLDSRALPKTICSALAEYLQECEDWAKSKTWTV